MRWTCAIRGFDGFCLVFGDCDFTRLAARIRGSGLAVYGFGERKTPKPFVAACGKFIYVENPGYGESATAAAAAGEALKPAPRATAAQLKRDTALVTRLRSAVEAASDDDGWAALAWQIITNQSPDFDSRSYGYAKLRDLMAAATLVDLARRSPGDGKPEVIYARDTRRRPARKPRPGPASPRASTARLAMVSRSEHTRPLRSWRDSARRPEHSPFPRQEDPQVRRGQARSAGACIGPGAIE